MFKRIAKNILIASVAVFVTACASNNASKFKGVNVLTNTSKSEGTLPAKELHVLFSINKNNVELLEVLPSKIKRNRLVTLLNKNEGKDFAKGDTFFDCIVLTNTSSSRSCFEDANRNVSDNSIFHHSETSGAMIAMTVLVPYLAVGAAGKGDFYVENKVDNELVNQIGRALKSKIFENQRKINKSLNALNFNQMPSNIKPYGPFIDHKTLSKAITKVKTMQQFDQLASFIGSVDYDGFVVKSPAVNEREKPTTRSKVTQKHKKGTLILADKVKDGWVYTGEGWVYKKILLSLSDDTNRKLMHKRNNLKINKSQELFLANANTSSKEVLDLLNNKAALKGVSKKKIDELVAVKNKLVEKESFEKAKKLHSIASYGNYLEAYPKGRFVAQAHESRELLWFKRITQQNLPGEFREFLDAYPKTIRFNDVRKQWFEYAKQTNTVEIYKDFLKGYAHTELESSAREQWLEIIKAQNTVERYRDFLSGYSMGPLEKQAVSRLEPLWYEKIAKDGEYEQVGYFLREIPSSKHTVKLSYAHRNCTRIARDFFTTRDVCVKRYIKIDDLRVGGDFAGYAQAYALSNNESDFYKAQALAKTSQEKEIVEYFAVLALADKSRLFSFKLSDKHVFKGNREHATWFAQGKGSSSAQIKGDLEIKLKDNAPFSIEYGNYNVATKLKLKAQYAKEVRSNWIGNSNTNPVVNKVMNINFNLSKNKYKESKPYNFGSYQVAYKDTGMMGGYTAEYLEREIEFKGQIASIIPVSKLNIF